MDELAKIYRVIDRELPYSDREVLLVLDATTGQNAVNQAREFKNVAEITGIVLTKLDGTARGGVVLAIKNELGIPVKFVGVGEQIDDLQPFKPRAFADGLFQKIDYQEEDAKNAENNEEEAVEAVGEDLSDAGQRPAPRADAENESARDQADLAASEETAAPADSAADEAGIPELESDSGEIEEKPKKKEKKRFGFFNRHA